ncbi:MAG: response regulator [Kofleriaceae bacterium]|nr:MAG: response regulator [Kofleriaceae bacterium]MBZ0236039.1 response regulator [Kofleriaceae bacterium]
MAGAPILVVDDNSTNLVLMRFILEPRGYAVTTASSAEEALAAIARQRPRLILMDLQMPGVSGFELTRQLKRDPATRDIVIVAVTAYAMAGDEERARAAGCDDYLTKPIDKERLRQVVADILARPA